MSTRLTALMISVLVLANASTAQDIILEENFEAGFPATWSSLGSSPAYWHVTNPGDCGAVTRMAAYNNGAAASCSYSTAAFQSVGMIATPYLSFLGSPPLEVHFDYRLQVDGGDRVEVVVVPVEGSSWSEYVIASEADLLNDAALHSISIPVSGLHPQTGESFRVEWRFASDLIGNQGFGLMVDNIRITHYFAGVTFCMGDGTAGACPCANFGGPGEGCAHSGGMGALLEGSGSASVSGNLLAFHAQQLKPGQPALLFQGNNEVNGGLGMIFGDGLRCAGGSVVRLGVQAADASGGASWGPGLAAAAGWSAGQTRSFQVWFRDPLGLPCGSNFNLSNGVTTLMAP